MKRHSAWETPSFNIKNARLLPTSASHEYQEPRVVNSFPENSAHASIPKQAITDFTSWTEKDLKAYLDRRGEDYDDCVDFYALARRAFESEEQAPTLAAAAQDEEDDPLEAFMADIDHTIAKQRLEPPPSAPQARPAGNIGCDDDDAMEEYIEAHAAFQAAKPEEVADYTGYGSDEEVYAVAEALDTHQDDDDVPQGKQGVDPLPPVQHELINYAAFKKDLYDENPEVFVMDDAEVKQKRLDLEIHVSGADVQKPVGSFEHCGFDKKLMEAIHKAGYKDPTPIQMQALPVRYLQYYFTRIERVINSFHYSIELILQRPMRSQHA